MYNGYLLSDEYISQQRECSKYGGEDALVVKWNKRKIISLQ